MIKQRKFETLNRAKANFDSIYERADPREYFRVLSGLDYVIPDLAQPVFRNLISALRDSLSRSVKVLDLGCSYGINAALAKYPLDTRRLAQRYVAAEIRSLSSETLIKLDRHYFRSWPISSDTRFVGLDSSEAAAQYGLNAGLLDAAISTNLETGELTNRDRDVIRDVDLIISTGSVGYLTHASFRRILATYAPGHRPWVANFVLRMFPYDAIAHTMREFDLVTEKLDGVTFVQRRFHSEEEARATLEVLDAMGVDTTGKEAEGLLHAELYLSRPRAWVELAPLSGLVSITSGAGRRYGQRFARQAKNKISLVN